MKVKEKKKCELHSPYYCYRTGGLRCKKCKILLNDNGLEYKKSKQ